MIPLLHTHRSAVAPIRLGAARDGALASWPAPSESFTGGRSAVRLPVMIPATDPSYGAGAVGGGPFVTRRALLALRRINRRVQATVPPAPSP